MQTQWRDTDRSFITFVITECFFKLLTRNQDLIICSVGMTIVMRMCEVSFDSYFEVV